MLSKNRIKSGQINNKSNFGKQSVDYDDTDFLQKMFSNVDSDIRNLNKNTGNQSSMHDIRDPQFSQKRVKEGAQKKMNNLDYKTAATQQVLTEQSVNGEMPNEEVS